jgi:hypothetical protein
MNPRYFLLLLFPFFTSCATITRGVHEKLKVESEPTGADVRLSSGQKGVTPATFVMSRKENFAVTVSKAGYLAQTVKVESKFSSTGGTAMAGNFLAGGIIGVGVDAMSGATSSLYPNPVSVRLVPSGKLSSTKRPASKPKSEKRTSSPQASPSPNPKPKSTSSPAPTPAPTPTQALRDAASTPGPEKQPDTPENSPSPKPEG